jgi:hypothetical protein
VDLQRDRLHLPAFRVFLIAAAHREFFHPVRTLEALKRVFAALAISGREEKDLDAMVLSFMAKPMADEYQLPKLSKLSKTDARYIRMAAAFTKHQAVVRKKFTNENSEGYRKKRLDHLKAIVESPPLVVGEHVDLEEEG